MIEMINGRRQVVCRRFFKPLIWVWSGSSKLYILFLGEHCITSCTASYRDYFPRTLIVHALIGQPFNKPVRLLPWINLLANIKHWSCEFYAGDYNTSFAYLCSQQFSAYNYYIHTNIHLHQITHAILRKSWQFVVQLYC